MAEYIEKSGLKKSMSALLSIENVPSDIKQLVMDIIDGEMLADVQPVRRGYWKKTNDIFYRYCSVCGTKTDIAYSNVAKFCPECGADMRGEDNV